MKKFFRRIHLYLGLSAGLVITTSCLTGAILVFEKEWKSLCYPDRYFVDPQPSLAPISKSVASVEEAVKGSKVTSVKVYRDPERTLEIVYAEKKKHEEHKPAEKTDQFDKDGKPIKKKPEAGKGPGKLQAYTNPYTGELITLYNHKNTFFYTVFALHRWLLSGDTGKFITGISTLIFIFILITGIILWWPKTKAKLKQHLTIKWGASWKRLTHDLHIVIGFYASIILFASAFTGLAWAFEWFNDGIYWVTGTENKRPEPPKSVAGVDSLQITFDEALAIIQKESPEATYYNLSKPKEKDGSFEITVLPTDPIHEQASDQYFLDQYTGKLIGTSLYQDRNLGQRVRSTFYPIHVGSIGGITGKILSFLACIAGVSFPVTGVIMWINRLKKKGKKNNRKDEIAIKQVA